MPLPADRPTRLADMREVPFADKGSPPFSPCSHSNTFPTPSAFSPRHDACSSPAAAAISRDEFELRSEDVNESLDLIAVCVSPR
jgi:hypothetical protein